MTGRFDRDHLAFKQQVQYIFGSARILIYAVGWIFSPFIAYVQLKDISLASVITNTGGYFISQCALILYYNSWIIAGNSDSKMFESVYAVLPDGDKIPRTMFIQMPILMASAALLFLTSKNEQWLARSLFLFFLVDVGAWMNNARIARSMVWASADYYWKNSEIYDFERLKHVARYLFGDWQWKRYIVMGTILVLYELIVFVDVLRNFVGSAGAQLFPEIGPATVASFVTGMIFAGYIVIAELSVWSVRLKTKAIIDILDEQRIHYSLERLR